MPRPHITLIIPDVHVPFHNDKLVNRVARLNRDLRPDHIVFSGDFLDLYSLSRHNRGSVAKLKGIDLATEYRIGRDVIERFIGQGNADISYLFGNHEDNYLRHLADGDNCKVGRALGAPEDALGLCGGARGRGRRATRRIRVYRNWMEDSVKVGPHLEVVHGLYTCAHSAKKHLDEFESSVMFGHTHRFQSYVTQKRGAYNIGFLGDPKSVGFSYAPKAQRLKWVNGFAVVYTMDDGSFVPVCIQCWNGRFVFNGRTY